MLSTTSQHSQRVHWMLGAERAISTVAVVLALWVCYEGAASRRSVVLGALVPSAKVIAVHRTCCVCAGPLTRNSPCLRVSLLHEHLASCMHHRHAH